VQRGLAGLGDRDLAAAHARAVARCVALLNRLAQLGDAAPASYTDTLLRVQAALEARANPEQRGDRR
jgi:hypothetical protein